MTVHQPNSSVNFVSLAAINHLRTGNFLLDMAIAMVLPIMLAFMSDGRGKAMIESVIAFLRRRFASSSTTECIRTITHISYSRQPYGSGDKKNDSLQKALVLYWTAHGQSFETKAKIELCSLQDAQRAMRDAMQYDKHNPLQMYRLCWTAPDDTWVDIGDGIQFRQYRTSDAEGGGSGGSSGDSKREQLIFELKSPDGPKRIDDLVQRALEWYKKELLSSRDDSRYLYTIVSAEKLSMSSSKSSEDDDSIRYKRYALSDQKTFESLFFPDKESLLSLLDDFSQRKGKYGVKGYPQKLGVLLHGPPGTGKTSLIKALAHETGRSIVSIPLAQIKTNQELMNVMYDLRLKVDGVDSAPQLAFKDVIFVIEDIDAASKVVLRRDERKSSPPVNEKDVDDLASAASAVGNTGLASLLAKGRAQAQAGCPPVPPPAPAACEEGPKPQTMADLMGDLLRPRPDELNLAGILNVLDGVVDTPGRIVIVTSNHPEKLDPALIRPGRIDRLIHLGYIQAHEAALMISHYFGSECSTAQRERLDELLGSAVDTAPKTPAALEQLCARFSTIDELLGELSECKEDSIGSIPSQLPTFSSGDAGGEKAQSESINESAKHSCGALDELVQPDSCDLVPMKRQVSGG
uniref:AAA+ ATPase domain-containing protein n=1 Tax=Haptolina brevifila TaxID=156173 RepID=A0A7S2MPL9_9EUKA|mmetsp:Transcript_56090/g.111332  ORF Transcript_56090/g.111332 Transcript_56090/m.111332 type:complete len:633 (+) Transcript_56090:93-1991(+)